MIMNNMKHLLYTVAILLMAASCSNEEMEQVTGSGKAKMQFRLSTSECPVQIVTRATPVPDMGTFTIRVKNAEGIVEVEGSLDSLEWNSPAFLPAEEAGTKYTVEAFSNEPTKGKVVLDKPCFYAKKDTIIFPDETVTVKLECSLQQFQVSFVPSATFMSAFRSDDKVDEEAGQKKFSMTVSDANGRSEKYNYTNLDKSVYFDGDKASSYIKIHVEGTTIKGFPVDFTETIEPEDGSLTAKDHLIINLEVAESQSLNIKATQIEL